MGIGGCEMLIALRVNVVLCVCDWIDKSINNLFWFRFNVININSYHGDK